MTQRQITIINALKAGARTIADLEKVFSPQFSERTLQRELNELVQLGCVAMLGQARATEYEVTLVGRLFLPIDVERYNQTEPDKRLGTLQAYAFDVWSRFPNTIFDAAEISDLQIATDAYRAKVASQSDTLKKRELERFVIEMSWKSARIEGNTYTLLDTELLLKEGIVSDKNTPEETQMILNHKLAFDYVLQHRLQSSDRVTQPFIENIHNLLVDKLAIEAGLRKQVVGITGSVYQPLDNQYQIAEALHELLAVVNRQTDTYSKALVILLGISYIQPFTDGNKRTARMVANALLLADHLAPLTYRNVDEINYRGSLLVFYEQLALYPMKELFMQQYIFATKHYSVQ